MLLHKVAWRGAGSVAVLCRRGAALACCVGPLGERRRPVQEGSSLGVLCRATWRAAPVGRCVRGRLALFQWGLSVVAGGRREEGWGRWRGKGWCDGFQVCRLLSARAVYRLLTDTVYLASVLWSATAGGLALGLSVWLTSILCSTRAEGLALGLSVWLLVVCFCLGVLTDCSCFLVSVWKFCWLSLSDCSLFVCSCSLVCCFCWLCCSSCSSCVIS